MFPDRSFRCAPATHKPAFSLTLFKSLKHNKKMKKVLRTLTVFMILVLIGLAVVYPTLWLDKWLGIRLYGFIFGWWVSTYFKQIYKYLFDQTPEL